jgi:hypothetical protein
MYRLFRDMDRRMNVYPELEFPHIFLLEHGYSNFYQNKSNQKYCSPKSYMPMDKEEYKKECSFYMKFVESKKRKTNTNDKSSLKKFKSFCFSTSVEKIKKF